MSTQNISISTKTIFKILAILFLVYLLSLLKEVFALFFVSLVLASAFDPTVDWLQKKKVPRAVSILAIYFIVLLVVGIAVYLLGGRVAAELKAMALAFPDYFARLTSTWNINWDFQTWPISETISSSIKDIFAGLKGTTTQIFTFLNSFFGGVINFFMVLVITFYITVYDNDMKSFVNGITPKKNREYVNALINQMKHRMGFWLRGQLILSVIIFFLTWFGLSVLGIKYALILALVAGVFEIVPFIGPLLSAVPAIFFGFTQSPTQGILVAILYLIVQQVENNIIVPKVMGKSTGLNPLVVLLSILAGAQLYGIVGALLAVPVATALSVYVESVIQGKKLKEEKSK